MRCALLVASGLFCKAQRIAEPLISNFQRVLAAQLHNANWARSRRQGKLELVLAVTRLPRNILYIIKTKNVTVYTKQSSSFVRNDHIVAPERVNDFDTAGFGI